MIERLLALIMKNVITKKDEVYKDNNKQLEWINVIRGIVIITMLIGHSNAPLGIRTIIYGFHMPFFFILSGYLFNKEKWQKLGFKKLFINKFRAYIIPYFCWSFVNLIINIPADYAKYGRDGIVEATLERIGWILYSNGDLFKMPNCTPLWFLPAIFISVIYLYGLLKVSDRYKVLFLFGGVVINVVLEYFNVGQLPWHIDVCMIGTLFMYVGVIIKEKNLLDKNISFISVIVLVCFGLYAIWKNELISMVIRDFNNIILTIIGSVFVSFVLLFVSKKFDFKCKLLSLLGRNTIIIMALNYAVNKLITSLWRQVTFLEKYDCNWVILSILDVVIFTGIIFIYNRLKLIQRKQ